MAAAAPPRPLADLGLRADGRAEPLVSAARASSGGRSGRRTDRSKGGRAEVMDIDAVATGAAEPQR